MDVHRRYAMRNRLHTLWLLAAMLGLFLLLGMQLFGLAASIWMLLLGGVMLSWFPGASAWLTLRLYRARPLRPGDVPELYHILGVLAERAGLMRAPQLFLIPSLQPNAFALEEEGEPLIAVTSGLLQRLDGRELAGVLAHEISHVRNGDLRVMMLADFFSRITAALSHMGVLLCAVMLPLWMVQGYAPPFLTILLLLAAPLLSTLLQLALSRTREFDADLGAAELTGDPLALASALAKIDQLRTPWWQMLVLSGKKQVAPSWLRTHPLASERIERLQRMAERTMPHSFHSVSWGGASGHRWEEDDIRPARWYPLGIWR